MAKKKPPRRRVTGSRGSTLGAAWRGVSGSAVKADLVEECREGELDAVRGGAVSKSGAG